MNRLLIVKALELACQTRDWNNSHTFFLVCNFFFSMKLSKVRFYIQRILGSGDKLDFIFMEVVKIRKGSQKLYTVSEIFSEAFC